MAKGIKKMWVKKLAYDYLSEITRSPRGGSLKIAEAENSAKSAIAIVGGIILPTTECRAGWTSPITH